VAIIVTQGKLIAIWFGMMVLLGGIYGYMTWRSNQLGEPDRSQMVKEDPSVKPAPAPKLALGTVMPVYTGSWIAPDDKGPETKGRVVLLDFWGTFCAPCIAAIPSNNTLLEKFSKQGLVVLGVSQDSKIALIEFKKNVDVRYPLLASNPETFAAFQVETTPSLFLFDRSGKLVWKGLAIEHKDGSISEPFEKALIQALETK